MNSSAPILSARNLRIDREGVPLCENLSIDAEGDRIVLAGAGAEAIADAIAFRASVASGHLTIDGLDVGAREHIGRVGVAPLDPPLPPRMTVHGYVSLCLRTAGYSSSAATRTATANLTDLGLDSLLRRRTESLAVPERRAALLAAAMLPNTSTVVAQSPLSGLEGPASQYVLAVLGHLANRRRVVATTVRFDAQSAERDLIMGATHVMIVDRRDVLWSGTPSELVQTGSLISLSIRGNEDAFLSALVERGLEPHGSPPRFAISRDDDTDLLALAEQTGTTILEIMPIVRASELSPSLEGASSGASKEVSPSSATSDTSAQEQTP